MNTDKTKQIRFETLDALVKEGGLEFNDCVNFFHSKQTKKQNALAAKAAEEYEEEGRIEIDENAIVSEEERDPIDGAYVMAWVYVYK